MNKLTKCLLTLSLTAAICGAVACGGNSSDAWKGTTFTDYGAVKTETVGGLVAETDKYIYFINGVGSSSSDNTFGTPIKGALVAADKNDLSSTQVVVPELMVSTDYGAGVYIFEEGNDAYAYYGTPNKEKTSSGTVAYSEMTFTRTRLDGKENKKLFTVSSHSTSYRIAQAEDGAIYIVYYDVNDNALISYNCSDGTKEMIAKTDAKTNDKNADGEYLSLGEYTFLNNGSGAQVVYTMTVYTQEYFAAQEEQEDSYTRKTATYNYMYLYKAGVGAVKVKGDKVAGDVKYSIKSNVEDYLFYTETKLGGAEKTFGAKVSALDNAEEIYYSANVKDGMIIKSFSEVYYFDSDAKQVVKNTLIKDADNGIDEFSVKAPILKDDTVSSLIGVDGGYIYCFNTDGYIVAIERANEERTIRISERTASTSWYAPEIVEQGGVEYMLYCDNSSEGNSYIHYANLGDLTAENGVIKEDTDDDGENDLYYLKSSFIGVMPAQDRAASAVTVINKIESTLDAKAATDENGKTVYYADSVKAARAKFDALDSDAKKYVEETYVKKLENAEKALELWAAFIKLEPVRNYANLSAADKTTLAENYDAAKTLVESYGDDYSVIAAYLTDNLNYFYQETGAKLAEPTEEE